MNDYPETASVPKYVHIVGYHGTLSLQSPDNSLGAPQTYRQIAAFSSNLILSTAQYDIGVTDQTQSNLGSSSLSEMVITPAYTNSLSLSLVCC